MPHKQFSDLDQQVDRLVRMGKPKIAFGLKKPDKEILASLRRARKYADIVLVGPEMIKGVKGFEIVVSNTPEVTLATMLARDKIRGIVRGTIDDLKTVETYEKLTGEKCTFSPAIMEDTQGRRFLLGPANNVEGWEKEERLGIAEGFADFVEMCGMRPNVAVFTGRRHETYPRKKGLHEGVDGILNKTYKDAEWIVAKLKKLGYKAKNWTIDLDPAIEAGSNILIPVNGMVGNQIFRALLVCGSKILTCTRMGYSRPYEDNSRTEKDFEYHVKWLTSLINKKKK